MAKKEQLTKNNDEQTAEASVAKIEAVATQKVAVKKTVAKKAVETSAESQPTVSSEIDKTEQADSQAIEDAEIGQSESIAEEVVEFVQDPVGATPETVAYAETPQCQNKPVWRLKVEKFGLIPMGLMFVVSIVFSVINGYGFYKNAFNMLFMGLGCLFFAAYEGVLIYAGVKCGCEVCKTARKPLIIKTVIGVVAFIGGLVAFILFH